MFDTIRAAVRQIRHHPGFFAVATLVLGLGLGAATTVFTLVDAIVLRPLPYRQPGRLVTLWDTNASRGLAHDPISPVNFMDYRALPVFADAAAWWRPAVNLVDPGQDPVRVNAIETSANLFQVLGVHAQIGEGFPEHGPFFLSNAPIAVISDRLWRARYRADPAIVGRQLVFGTTAYTIAGVMPPAFHFPDDVDVWERLGWDLTQHSRAAHFMESVARLSADADLAQATAATNALAARLQNEYAGTNAGWGVRLVPLLDESLGYYRPALLVLFGAVGLLLLIGCLNVASLLLTRALSREREMAVRVALGAAPRQLARQLIAESFVLSAAGAAAGLVVAAVALPIVVRLSPVRIPRLDDARLDVRAFGIALAVVALTTIVFGMVPSWVLLRGRIASGLRMSDRGSSRGARRVYTALVVGEIALACTMLVSSALLVRTVARMVATPLGVDADTVVTSRIQLDGPAYRSWRAVADTHAHIIELIRLQPGVTASGGSNFLPLDVAWRVPFDLEGWPPADAEDGPRAQFQTVTDGYFEAMGAVLAEGRSFVPFDTADSSRVVIVNESFAKQYLSNGRTGSWIATSAGNIGPLGVNLMRQTPATAESTRFQIVGVVRDIRNAPLGQRVEPTVYFASSQFPFRELFVTVRAADRASAVNALRAAVRNAAPTVPFSTPRTWGEIFASRTAEPRLLMTVLLFFSVLAALLAAIGVYGLLAWSVALRTRELAIRLTLGAKPRSVGGLILRQSALLTAGGLAIGVLLVRLGDGVLAKVLFGIPASDPAATATAGAVLASAAILACLPAARRAMRVEPAAGLRAE